MVIKVFDKAKTSGAIDMPRRFLNSVRKYTYKLVISVRNCAGTILRFFKNVFQVIKSEAFQAMLLLYLLRVASVTVLVVSVEDGDWFGSIISGLMVAVTLLPMEKLFSDLLVEKDSP